MQKNVFRERERAEEAAYFRKEDEKLLAKLRERAQLSEIALALAKKLQVDDPKLLKRIMQLGVTVESGAAFVLAPLVEIAWADGHVSPAEHDAVLRVAFERGVGPGSADLAQLLKWLQERPSDALFQTALEAIRVGLAVLPRDEAEQRITTMIKACEDVAEVSGGLAKLFHRHSGISPQEQSLIDEIRARLMQERQKKTLIPTSEKEIGHDTGDV